MNAFADSSAVVKLYADESGSRDMHSLEAMYVSQLCRVEVPSALWRKTRMSDLTAADAQVLVAAFESDLFGDSGMMASVAISPGILDRAAALAAIHGLRAYDAVQLASAVEVRTIDSECDTLAAFDRELRRSASREGFRLYPSAT